MVVFTYKEHESSIIIVRLTQHNEACVHKKANKTSLSTVKVLDAQQYFRCLI